MTNARGAMPWAIRVFLGYAFLILGGIGLSLRFIVDQAISAPVSPVGVVVMALLAYTVFTTTLVLQRKAAAHRLAFGLVSLIIPAMALTATSAPWPVTLFLLALGGLLLVGLRGPAVAAWLVEP